MSEDKSVENSELILEEDKELTLFESLHRTLGFLNDLLLIPMFASLIFDGDTQYHVISATNSNLIFCAFFFSEWLIGLLATSNKKEYLLNGWKISDLVSSLPIGSLFQGLRLLRLLRVIKLFRLVIRAKRYQGPGAKILRLLAMVGSTTFAGGYTMFIVEGQNNPDLSTMGDTLWWSLVTISTVGYGDKFPITGPGRIVAVVLILIGLGVCGYIAGFMANFMSDEHDDEPDLVSLKNQLNRVEQKLDRLGAHLELEEWEDLNNDLGSLKPPKERSSGQT